MYPNIFKEMKFSPRYNDKYMMARMNNAPKLLFHGTAALSAWYSYRRSQSIFQEQPSGAAVAKRSLNRGYSALGPFYPDPYSPREVCLAKELVISYVFASSNRASSFGEGSIDIKGQGQHIRLIPACMGVDAEILQSIADYIEEVAKPISTPGVILLIDGVGLSRDGLLGPPICTDEEYAIAHCLPWSYIRGLLLVQETKELRPSWRITAHYFFNPLIKGDMINMIKGKPHLFSTSYLQWLLK